MFTDLNLIPEIQQALADVEYTSPTPIQAQSIPHLIDGRDLLGCAQTGTGKTAAFALPILNRLGINRAKSIPNRPRVLILAPTRELASQIGDSFLTYGKHLRTRTTVIFGGVGQGRQVQSLNRGVHVLVATPGRLLDLMNQGHIHLEQLETFVLDEADRMLDMGFLPDLKRIIAKLPKQRHSLFFSATLPGRVAELAAGLLTDPVRVEVAPQSSTVELIEQQVLYVSNLNKGPLLDSILKGADVGKAIVFTRTKRGADRLAKQLTMHGIKAEAIHGNKSQNARTRTLDQFKSEKLSVLVATDLAARGLDVEGLTHVVNYDLPVEPESYVHRIGRTGRAGASGIAYTLCDSSERSQLRAIEKLIRRSVPVHPDFPDKFPAGASTRPAAGKGRQSGGRPNNGGGSSGAPRRPKQGSGRHGGAGGNAGGERASGGRGNGKSGGKRFSRQP
ncbi:DEAD/DEAH box helicase [Planctomicrobium sp. SH668]|uniref:DEAD/DEAH box helicase n=1 Tax=Planctomicrobium sp. SH668 TaxID=3448126 RepID=UPI003F5BF213